MMIRGAMPANRFFILMNPLIAVLIPGLWAGTSSAQVNAPVDVLGKSQVWRSFQQTAPLPITPPVKPEKKSKEGFTVDDAGYPFGEIPDWLLRQRIKPPDWAPDWAKKERSRPQ